MKRFYIPFLAIIIVASFSSCGPKNGEQQLKNQFIEVADGVQRLELDSLKLTWIKDNQGLHIMPLSLFAAVDSVMADTLNVKDGIPSSIGTFYMEFDSTAVLFDAGMGAENSQLVNGLAAISLKPEDIKCVVLTHFHGDHIGGLVKDGKALFPNAALWAPKVEYDAWMAMDKKDNAQAVEIMSIYKDNLNLFQIGDMLPGGIKAIAAYGHTPGHTLYQKGKVLIVADIMHGAAVQLRYPEISAAYDMAPELAAKVRKEVLKYVKENNLIMAGMHLPEPAMILPE